MPYRSVKYLAKGGMYRNKRNYSNYAKGAGAVALGVAGYKLARKLKDKLNVEFKSIVSNYGLTNIGPVDASAHKLFLTGIDVGDTGATRDGRQVRLKGLTLHGKISLNQSSAGSNPPTLIRMIVFQQKSCCGATIPTLDQLINPGAAGGSVLGFYNLDNVPINYRILKDKTYTLTEDRECVYVNMHIKNNSVMRYDGNTTTYDDQATNAVFCYIFSDVGSNLPDGDLSVRIRYVDN